jgi:hypothetical protein
LLAHPSAEQIVSLTPEPGPAVPVSGVTLVRDVSHRPEDVADAVLVVLDDVPRTDWRLDALVSRAHAAGVAAVLLPGQEPLRSATTLLAGRLQLPVLGARDAVTAYATIGDLLNRSAAEVSRTVLATVAACWRAGADPQDVVRGFSEVLGRALALLDHAGRAVVGPDVVTGADRDRLAGRLADWPIALPHPMVIEGLDSGEVVALRVAPGQPSWLCVHLPEPLPVEREAVSAAIPIAVGAIRERLAERRLRLERDARARTSALEEITRHPSEASTVLRRRALDLGWDLDGWHVGVYVGVLGEVDLMVSRQDLLAAFEAESLAIQAVEQADGWAVWTTSDTEPSSEDAVRHAAAVRRAQRRFENSATGTYVGVGRAQVGAEGIAGSLAEARDAARLARSREETGRFLHVDRLGFGQLLLGWTRTDSFRPAANALLEPLARAPGELVGTLGAYLDCESSLAHTAAVLGIHRNTVAARISRVQELLGVDLANPDERLALHLACKTTALPDGTVHND